MRFPKISIVTPCYNQKNFIQESIESVLLQEYPNVELIVIDGGSTDGTVEIIKRYEHQLKYWISETDNGLYDALNKGFVQSTGEIMGWLNSDDLLQRKSLFTIAEIFTQVEEVNWIQGYPTVIDETGRVLYHRLPVRSKYDLFLRKYRDGMFVQQESTYWRRSLWNKAGGKISLQYKYAGDFELWMRFFEHDVIYNTNAIIGTFRRRGGNQLSVLNASAYLQECDSIIDELLNKLSAGDRVGIAIKKFFLPLKNRLQFYLNDNSGRNCVNYDFNDLKFHPR